MGHDSLPRQTRVWASKYCAVTKSKCRRSPAANSQPGFRLQPISDFLGLLPPFCYTVSPQGVGLTSYTLVPPDSSWFLLKYTLGLCPCAWVYRLTKMTLEVPGVSLGESPSTSSGGVRAGSPVLGERWVGSAEGEQGPPGEQGPRGAQAVSRGKQPPPSEPLLCQWNGSGRIQVPEAMKTLHSFSETFVPKERINTVYGGYSSENTM